MLEARGREFRKIERMRPRHMTKTFDWLDCEAPAPQERRSQANDEPRPEPPLTGAAPQHAQQEGMDMFRIHSNIPKSPTMTQPVSGLRFDGRERATQTDDATPTASEQIRIVGQPTSADHKRAEVGRIRQMNHDVASAATVGQIAETKLTNVSDMLVDMLRVATAAQNTDLTEAQRQQLASEARAIHHRIAQVSNSTRINGIPLLNGAQRALTFQIGSGYESAEVHLSLMDTRPTTLLPGVEPERIVDPTYAQKVAVMLDETIAAVHERL
ncbi:MAG: hypothetical protein O3A46_16895, partial [Candidatus Poribacteria bacterium]|nr:hypothetical protein [Candidatus Poribacteria bacterium]